MARPRSEDSSNIAYTAAEERLPFLDGNTQLEEKSYGQQQQYHGLHRCRLCSFIYWPFILLSQFIFTVIILTVIVQRFSGARSSIKADGRDSCLNPPGLLRPAVKYAVKTPPGDWWDRPLYTDLSTESGMAWQGLLNQQALRISTDEINQFNIPVSLWEGKELPSGGFAAVPGVFHNLHCLRHMKQELFKEYYFPDRTVEEAEARVEHTKHCMEVLRQSVMCNADLTPLPLLWSLKQNTSYVKPEVSRQCMDWNSLLDSTKGKQYGYEEIIPKELIKYRPI